MNLRQFIQFIYSDEPITEIWVQENKKDLDYAKKANLSSALIDRLLLDEKRIKAMADAIRVVASLKDPVGRVIEGWTLDNGLKIEKVKIPIGVIGIIYESRPNVTSDAAALTFMSGNACILKGGKEAMNSNKIIIEILQNAPKVKEGFFIVPKIIE